MGPFVPGAFSDNPSEMGGGAFTKPTGNRLRDLSRCPYWTQVPTEAISANTHLAHKKEECGDVNTSTPENTGSLILFLISSVGNLVDVESPGRRNPEAAFVPSSFLTNDKLYLMVARSSHHPFGVFG